MQIPPYINAFEAPVEFNLESDGQIIPVQETVAFDRLLDDSFKARLEINPRLLAPAFRSAVNALITQLRADTTLTIAYLE